MSKKTIKLLFLFPKMEIEKPIIYHLIKDYDLVVNIFRARVSDKKEGFMIFDLTGEQENIDAGLAFATECGVTIDEINKGVRWNEDRCTQCGNCVAHCPTQALHIADRETMKIDFTEELCIECLNCLKNCPYDACRSIFQNL